MPRYTIIIENPVLARDKEVERNVRVNLQAHQVDRMGVEEQLRARKAIAAHAERVAGPLKAAGDVYSVVELPADVQGWCPDDRPNCEHCGDPEHEDACKAAGHCADCRALRHGVAPDAVAAANGLRVEEV